MKIANVSLMPDVNLLKYKMQDKNQSLQTNTVVRQETTGIPGMYAYRDYNISFGARLFRTPQNFYEQEFNEQNMPATLHKYIYEEGDTAFKRTIPPAQAMKEVFGNIKNAKDLDAVRRLYPDEPLFQNLTSTPKRKSREGLLGMINILKDDPSYTDKTLFKNGKNDLGMYILQKIYIEGKTLKEINKDFAKDVSVHFKSYDITPQDYAAFGIKFPNRPFWKSFIATREDFPYVYIPRTISSPSGNKNVRSTGSNRTMGEDNIQKPRKYNLKDYHKKQLKSDIVEAKGDVETIKRKVVKRFKKDDPEASFIIKYMSPIMTIASDKIHLSEEMRYFTEDEKINGKSVKGSSMFERFWRSNPALLHEFSTAITDTIELFEDVYAGGGMIPMNKEFEQITKKSLNQKAIDYVNPDFLELLDYSKTIEPERNDKYAKHEEMQALWEQHFVERYGNPESLSKTDVVIETEAQLDLSTDEAKLEFLKREAEKNNAEFITLRGKNGEDIHLTYNVDEVFNNILKDMTKLYPSSYASKFIGFVNSSTEISDKYKLSLVTRNVRDMIDDPRIMSDEEFEDETKAIYHTFYMTYPQQTLAAGTALADLINKYYTDIKVPTAMYRLYVDEYNDMVDSKPEIGGTIKRIVKEHRMELNSLYSNYSRDLTSAEMTKVRLTLLDQIARYTPVDGLLEPDIQEILLMLKEMTSQIKFRRRVLADSLDLMISNYKFSKSILDKSLTKEQKNGKFEYIMGHFIHSFLASHTETPILLTLLNREIIEAHKANLSTNMYNTLITMVDYTDSVEAKRLFEIPMADLKILDSRYKK